MKLFLFIISFSILKFCISGNTQGNKICWEENQLLTWKDFRGNIPNVSDYGAKTYIVLRYEQITPNEISITNCMLKNKSWVASEEKSSVGIMHEQYHFNIAEIFARKIRQELSTVVNPSISQIKIIFDSWIEKYNSEQILYDSETFHCLNALEQSKWQMKIDSQLIGLKQFRNEIVSLKNVSK